MDDAKPHTTEAEEPRSVARAVERLFAGATEAFTRAANCNDSDWQKFHLGTAAAYNELALQMEQLIGVQARIDEQVAMIRRRFNLGVLPRRDDAAHKPAPEDVMVASASSLSETAMSYNVDRIWDRADYTEDRAWDEMRQFLKECEADPPRTSEQREELNKRFIEIQQRCADKALEVSERAAPGNPAPHLKELSSPHEIDTSYP